MKLEIDNAASPPFEHVSHHMLIVFTMLLITAVLAVTSLVGDSITFDETSHLTSGYSYLKTGDFRLGPGTPPLAKLWCAWPVWLMHPRWPTPDTPGWREGNEWIVGLTWLFELNHGETLMTVARCMMVLLLLAACLSIYQISRVSFGPRAAYLALAVAVFSPTFLAHGRLVTTDLPYTLGVIVTLWAFARLLELLCWARLAVAAAALSALSLTKFTWPLVIPALALMGATALFRQRPIPLALGNARPRGPMTLLVKRRDRIAVLLLVMAGIGLLVWGSIWTCFAWRYSPFRGADREQATMLVVPPFSENPPNNMTEAWDMILTDPKGEPMRGLTASFVRWSRARRLLPEAYIYGLAYQSRNAVSGVRMYLFGEIYDTGQMIYFPIAFAIKTPLATLLLAGMGISALLMRRLSSCRNVILMVGLIGFTVAYVISSLFFDLNIGHRHLLPIYPFLFVLAGTAAVWWRSWLGRCVIGSSLAWLIVATLWIHPHFLAYFNELIGGPRRGHLYLADSNLDWGQDIKRLARYARSHPRETIKLSYFGSGNPLKYGFDCEELISFIQFGGKPVQFTAGTYVISVNQMLALNYWQVADEVWRNPSKLEGYRRALATLAQPLAEHASEEERREREALAWMTRHDQQALLLNGLRRREPDDRIGYSLHVHRLSQREVDELLRREVTQKAPRGGINP